MKEEKVIEELSIEVHASWSRWMKYLFSRCYFDVGQFDKSNGNLVIPKSLVRRWKRQIETNYNELSEEEKESDRKEARNYLNIIKRYQ